jgi:hypothetical protein
MKNRAHASSLSQIETAIVPENALAGSRVALLVNERPVSLLSSDVTSEYNADGLEILTIVMKTTREAIDTPDVNAAVSLAWKGFAQGESVAIRFPGGSRCGLARIEWLFLGDLSIPGHAQFEVTALVDIRDSRKPGLPVIYEKGEKFFIDTVWCEKVLQ